MRTLGVPVALAAGLVAAGAAGARTTPAPPPPLSILHHTAGLQSQRITTVALFCRQDVPDPCVGTAVLTIGTLKIGSGPFAIASKRSGKATVKLTKQGLAMVKSKPGRKRKVNLTVTMADGQVFKHVITLK